ncbi:DUF72 domain-containing protein [Bordetella genomosp. 13]|uniref:DUF72 domain-containing protein n=1 Tax=Bordetella genomosp. 13 TaxID=463040 RepID=A0A1W6Z9T2_9BORD|nr:DUF72 domain-containing protein [Bordetella genomosp. 13]ARP94158.1 hypothetical protein CAL15_07045 [Bordetella genomosp. 13]
MSSSTQRSDAAASIRIGISGWRYGPWRGTFYPEDLKQAQELAYASHQVPTIEINGTFYSLQRPERFAQWRDATPRGFVFSVKGGRYITHVKRLREPGQSLARFFASGMFELGDKLGPFLWQLPPSLRYDPDLVEAFLKCLPRDTDEAEALARRHDARVAGQPMPPPGPTRSLRHAMEVRHESFASREFVDMLRHYGVALVTADTAGKWPLLEDVTADFAYLRLHGDAELYASGYTPEALRDWARRIRAWSGGREPRGARRAGGAHATGKPRDVYCYFDNDMKVKAPGDARSLARLLGLPLAPDPPP